MPQDASTRGSIGHAAPGTASDGRPRHRRFVLAVLPIAIVAAVIRSPLPVLTLLGAGSTDAGGTATPQSAELPVPNEAHRGRVIEGIAAGEAGERGPNLVTDEPAGGDAPDGRWGASTVRPGGLGITLEEFRGGWRVEAGAEEAAALAVIAAHAWAMDGRVERPSAFAAGAALGAGAGAAPGAGVIVAVEAVERLGALHAVVTLLVATGSALDRIAVPVTFTAEGPSVAGPPWWLPPPTATAETVVGTAVGDPELLEAARRALDAVGIPGERLVALEATDGWPFIARLEDDAVGHPWLRWHLDRFVVSGLPLLPGGGPR